MKTPAKMQKRSRVVIPPTTVVACSSTSLIEDDLLPFLGAFLVLMQINDFLRRSRMNIQINRRLCQVGLT